MNERRAKRIRDCVVFVKIGWCFALIIVVLFYVFGDPTLETEPGPLVMLVLVPLANGACNFVAALIVWRPIHRKSDAFARGFAVFLFSLILIMIFTAIVSDGKSTAFNPGSCLYVSLMGLGLPLIIPMVVYGKMGVRLTKHLRSPNKEEPTQGAPPQG